MRRPTGVVLARIEASGAGRLILPWISRMARPEGVCRSCGSGLEGVWGLVLSTEGRWRGMEGMMVRWVGGSLPFLLLSHHFHRLLCYSMVGKWFDDILVPLQ